jgi:hypothetical protein
MVAEVVSEEILAVVQVHRAVQVPVGEGDGSMSPIVEILRNMEELPGREFEKFTYPAFADRFPRPEDIFGSLEVDGNGSVVGKNGNYQPSGKSYPIFILCPFSTTSAELTNAFQGPIG